jgi:hypothetical protein
MGDTIARLLELFRDRVPDTESFARVFELATTSERWSAAHAVFDEIRHRLLAARDQPYGCQYAFEELCCKSMYNAASPDDPFDPSSPFFVAGAAFELAQRVGVSIDTVVSALTPRRS